MTVLIGLMGAAGSGKSTAAQYMVERYAAKRYSFAGLLKAMVMRALDFSPEQVYGTQAQKEAIDPRYGHSPRWFLQRIGTEGCRAVFGQNFWSDRTLERIRSDRPLLAVIDDVRFVSETRAIQKEGGYLWRLECPDRQSAAGTEHASEREWEQAAYDQVVRASLSEGSVLLKNAIDEAVARSGAIRKLLEDGNIFSMRAAGFI